MEPNNGDVYYNYKNNKVYIVQRSNNTGFIKLILYTKSERTSVFSEIPYFALGPLNGSTWIKLDSVWARILFGGVSTCDE